MPIINNHEFLIVNINELSTNHVINLEIDLDLFQLLVIVKFDHFKDIVVINTEQLFIIVIKTNMVTFAELNTFEPSESIDHIFRSIIDTETMSIMTELYFVSIHVNITQ